MPSVERTITAENQFTDPMGMFDVLFNFSVSGSFAAIVTIQRAFVKDESGADIPLGSLVWHDIETYTGPYQDVGIVGKESVAFRAGVKTGEFTSGSVVLRISR